MLERVLEHETLAFLPCARLGPHPQGTPVRNRDAQVDPYPEIVDAAVRPQMGTAAHRGEDEVPPRIFGARAWQGVDDGQSPRAIPGHRLDADLEARRRKGERREAPGLRADPHVIQQIHGPRPGRWIAAKQRPGFLPGAPGRRCARVVDPGVVAQIERLFADRREIAFQNSHRRVIPRVVPGPVPEAGKARILRALQGVETGCGPFTGAAKEKFLYAVELRPSRHDAVEVTSDPHPGDDFPHVLHADVPDRWIGNVSILSGVNRVRSPGYCGQMRILEPHNHDNGTHSSAAHRRPWLRDG